MRTDFASMSMWCSCRQPVHSLTRTPKRDTQPLRRTQPHMRGGSMDAFM